MADVTIDDLTGQIANLRKELNGLQTQLNRTAGRAGGVRGGRMGGGGGAGGGAGSFSSGQSPMAQSLGAMSDAMGHVVGVASGISMMMPDTVLTMSRQRAFYEANAALGFSQRDSSIRAATQMDYMSSSTSGAMVSNILANTGFTPGTQQYTTAKDYVSGLTGVFNIESERGALAMGEFYSAGTSQSFMAGGIMMTGMDGQAKSPTEMFEEFFQRIYAGPMSEEQLNQELQRGYLNNSIRSLGLNPEMESALRTFIRRRYQGKTFDLSDPNAVKNLTNEAKSRGSRNTMMEAQYEMAGKEAELMEAAEGGTDKGVRDANDALIELANFTRDNLIPNFSELNSMLVRVLGSERAAGTIVAGQNAFNLPADIFKMFLPFGGSGQGGVPLANAAGGVGGIGGSVDIISGSTRITSAFGAQRDNGPHKGTDYAVPEGTPIKSAGDGEVVESRRSTHPSGGYGEYIKVQHDNGWQTLYAHLSRRGKAVGSKVRRGEQIGLSGNTGYSTGPHLHFEAINPSGQRVAPENLGVAFDGDSSNAPANTIGRYKPRNGTSRPSDLISTSSNLIQELQGEEGAEIPYGLSEDSFGQLYDPSAGISSSYEQRAGQTALPKSISNRGGGRGGSGEGGIRVAPIRNSAITDQYFAVESQPQSFGGGNTVNITLNIERASEEEARKFVDVVKRELEFDRRVSKAGGR